jgi:transposase
LSPDFGELAYSAPAQSPISQSLATVPGVGIMGASAIAATVIDPSLFRSGREFAAWLGMTPRQNSSGGKERLGRTSMRGDKYIRSLLIAGAVAVLRHARNRPTRDGAWVRALMERKPTKVAAVALANRTARIVWAVMMRGDGYRARGRFAGSRHRHGKPAQHARVKRT